MFVSNLGLWKLKLKCFKQIVVKVQLHLVILALNPFYFIILIQDKSQYSNSFNTCGTLIIKNMFPAATLPEVLSSREVQYLTLPSNLSPVNPPIFGPLTQLLIILPHIVATWKELKTILID